MKTFLSKIDKIKEEFELKKDRDFDREIGLTNKLYRWRNGLDKAVNLKTLLLIHDKFQKTLDWLLFEELPLTMEEFRPEPYESRPLAPTEAALLHKVIFKVDEAIKAQKKRLQPEQKSRLITRVYNDCAEDHMEPDAIIIKRYLWVID